MPTSLEQTRRTVEAYSRAQGRIFTSLLRILNTLWGGIPDWENPDMVRAWAARSTVDVDVALSQTRGLARGYILTRLGQLDAPARNLPPVVDSYERGGRGIVEIYQRPARERNYIVRKEIAKGTPRVEAEAKGQAAFVERLETIAAADVQATARDETQKVMASAPKVTGYRRIIHPEKSKTGTCALCMVAATRIYSTSDLMELHDKCKCTVDAVTSEADPGLELNEADLKEMLDRLYGVAGGTSAERLKNVRITSYEHGELGPVLIRSGSKFRTVDDVNASTKFGPRATPFKRQTRSDDRTNWRAMRATSERSIRYLQNAKSRGTNVVDLGTGRPTRVPDIDKAIQYHRDLIARADRHAA